MDEPAGAHGDLRRRDAPRAFLARRAEGANFSPSARRRQRRGLGHPGIAIRETATGRTLGSVAGVEGTMPDWSPDGSRIVFSESDWVCEEDWQCNFPSIRSARIATIERSGTTWSRGPVLVPHSGDNNFYPTFSPDGHWVLFNRSPSDSSVLRRRGPRAARPPALGRLPPAAPSASPAPAARRRRLAEVDPTAYQHRGEPSSDLVRQRAPFTACAPERR
jgi:hypothetical protein